jgi:ketosteroid isomerase-like protein
MAVVGEYLRAYIAQDADGCARTFTPDGALFSPFGPPAIGRAAIAATHSDWFALEESDKRLEIQEFYESGESGHCLLRWSARIPDGGEASGFCVARGMSLAVLKLTGGEILFSRMALVPDAP